MLDQLNQNSVSDQYRSIDHPPQAAQLLPTLNPKSPLKRNVVSAKRKKSPQTKKKAKKIANQAPNPSPMPPHPSKFHSKPRLPFTNSPRKTTPRKQKSPGDLRMRSPGERGTPPRLKRAISAMLASPNFQNIKIRHQKV